jgi:urease gamma subunit
MLESDPHDFERLHTGATAPERRKVEELLLESITHERAHQNEEHGEKFNSVPEAVAVLIEEIEEGSEEFNRVIKTAHDAWKDVRQDDSVDFVNKMEDIYRFAKFAAMECVQVAAVARKAIESIESEGAK